MLNSDRFGLRILRVEQRVTGEMSDPAPTGAIYGGDVRPIPVGKLKIPETQRTKLDEKRVDGMVADWQPRKVGILVVSCRKDGSLYVLDGWHRMAGMRKRGDVSALCEVLYDLSLAEEADIFLGR